jgi:hypothetical protein
MKSLKKILFGLALALLAAGCADILRAPGTPEAKPGKVVLSVTSGPARTVAPGISQFKKIIFTIKGEGNTADLEDVPVSGGGTVIEFPESGSWKITAKAYLGAEDTEPAAASVPHDFSWNGTTVTGATRFVLVPTGDGPGKLKYTITVPEDVALAGSGSRMLIELDGTAFADLDDDNFTDGEHGITTSEADVTAALPAGSYTVAILLVKDGDGHTAVYRENVEILPGLVTELVFAPKAEGFLDPAIRAAMTDLGDEALSFGATNINEDPFIDVGDMDYSGSSWTLDIAAPAGTSTVYFTLAKTAEYRVAIDEGDSDVASAVDSANGSNAGDNLAVFKVDTSAIAAAGGTVGFALAISKEGMIGTPVAVTVTVEAPAQADGPGLYIDTGTEGTESLIPVEVDGEGNLVTEGGTHIVSLPDALLWLGTNAADNTKYVILLGENYGLMTNYLSKDGSVDVRITLRGLGEERRIYWDNPTYAPSLQGTLQNGLKTPSGQMGAVFYILAGTTLVLDNNIALGGVEGDLSPYGPYIKVQKIGSFDYSGQVEMRGNSKIAYINSNPIVRVNNTQSSFKMYDTSSIRNNEYTINAGLTSSQGLVVLIGTPSGSFEMYDNACITDNTADFYTSNQSTLATYVNTGKHGIVTVENGTFAMHDNSLISNNTDRVLYITGGNATDRSASFSMDGGTITNNGNYTYDYNDKTYYIRGGAVWIANYTAAEIKGGNISGNGVSEKSDAGIFFTSTSAPLVLDETIAITDTIFLNNAGTFSINDNFVIDKPLSIYLNGATMDINAFIAFWNNKQLVTSSDSSSVSNKLSYFTLAGYMRTDGTNYSNELIFGLQEDGKISVVKKTD